MAEHVFEREQWLGQERDESRFSRRFVFCWSQAEQPETLDLISDGVLRQGVRLIAASPWNSKL